MSRTTLITDTNYVQTRKPEMKDLAKRAEREDIERAYKRGYEAAKADIRKALGIHERIGPDTLIG